MCAAGNAIFSGWYAAMVLGVISAKISMTKVSMAVAMAMPASPHRRIAITVAIEDASIFTKLLPIKIILISWSVLSNSLLALVAPLWPLFFRCFRRYLFNESMPVSALEKKPESMIRINRKISSDDIDESFNFTCLIDFFGFV